MEFRLLGPLEVIDGDALVALPAAKQRALLAILLLHANESVSGDRLIEDLWGDRPPISARKVLQTYVSKLRRLLGPATLGTRTTGYTLTVNPEDIDLHRFERLVTEAAAANPREAARKLRQALDLWRGRPLADFGHEQFALSEIARLEELRSVALERRIDADLRSGRHTDLVGELRVLVSEFPLRERLRGQMMLALYRSGRQAEALEVYRDGRRLLVDELGVEPSPPLRDLEQAILQQDPAIAFIREHEEDPPSHPPPVGVSVARIPSRPAVAAPAAGVQPFTLAAFLGRRQELADVQSLLRRPEVRLVTLTGAGGAGKTRLALKAAERLAADFRGGVTVVDLAAIREPTHVAEAAAVAVGLREPGPAGAIEALTEYLRSRELLLLVDNFEQVLEAAPVLTELLDAAPAVKILATSRSALRLPGEQVFTVPPMSLPTPDMTLSTLAATDAVSLFVDRARRVRTTFALDEQNGGTVAELCVRLDGMPLALELAAARADLLSPRAILSRLGRRLDLLKNQEPGVPERHRTLRAAQEWSYELLTTEQKSIFSSLAVFTNGFTLDEAESVAAEMDRPGIGVLEAVESLMHASLVRAEGLAGDEPRFGMLETIREYALERLEQQGRVAELRDRHAQTYLTLATQAEPELRGPDQARWLELLDAEHGNLSAALSWAAEAADPDTGLRTGAFLWRFWQVRGRVDEGRRQLERLLATSRGTPRARAAAELTIARCAFQQGDFKGLRHFAESSMPVHIAAEDDHSLGFTFMILGAATGTQGDTERGRSLLEQALVAARRGRDDWLESASLGYLGGVLAVEGQHIAARHALEDGLRGLRELGDSRMIGWTLISLGRTALAAADHDRARRRFDEALSLHHRLGDRVGVAAALQGLATLALDIGEVDRARALLAESIPVAWDANNRPGLAAALEQLACVAIAEGESTRAVQLFGCASVLEHALNYHGRPDGDHAEPERISALRALLGDEQFAERWADGRALTVEETIAFALGRAAGQ